MATVISRNLGTCVLFTRKILTQYVEEAVFAPKPMCRYAVYNCIQQGIHHICVQSCPFCHGPRDDCGGGRGEGKLEDVGREDLAHLLLVVTVQKELAHTDETGEIETILQRCHMGVIASQITGNSTLCFITFCLLGWVWVVVANNKEHINASHHWPTYEGIPAMVWKVFPYSIGVWAKS